MMPSRRHGHPMPKLRNGPCVGGFFDGEWTGRYDEYSTTLILPIPTLASFVNPEFIPNTIEIKKEIYVWDEIQFPADMLAIGFWRANNLPRIEAFRMLLHGYRPTTSYFDAIDDVRAPPKPLPSPREEGTPAKPAASPPSPSDAE